jgi:hypothetical protein
MNLTSDLSLNLLASTILVPSTQSQDSQMVFLMVRITIHGYGSAGYEDSPIYLAGKRRLYDKSFQNVNVFFAAYGITDPSQYYCCCLCEE